VAAGDSGREAYTAIAWGVGLSHERSDIAGAESFYSLEGNMCGTAKRGAVALPGSKYARLAASGCKVANDLGGNVTQTVDDIFEDARTDFCKSLCPFTSRRLIFSFVTSANRSW
jgi:hypothetical protein